MEGPDWDLEITAWESVRDAIPSNCRACKWATKIAFEGYDNIITGQDNADRTVLIIENAIKQNCKLTPIKVVNGIDYCGFMPEF